VTLGLLSTGRISIIANCSANLTSAVVIAVRYSLVRRQFTSPGSREEKVLLSYPSHQCRLMPLLAASLALEVYRRATFTAYAEFSLAKLAGDVLSQEALAAKGMEMHAISCAGIMI